MKRTWMKSLSLVLGTGMLASSLLPAFAADSSLTASASVDGVGTVSVTYSVTAVSDSTMLAAATLGFQSELTNDPSAVFELPLSGEIPMPEGFDTLNPLKSTAEYPNLGVTLYPLSEDDARNNAVPFEELSVPKDQEEFPTEIIFRDNTMSFNRVWDVYLHDGIIYVKHRNKDEAWREAPCPSSLRGNVTALSLDSTGMCVLDENNWIYEVLGMLEETEDWYYRRSWGGLAGWQPGYQLNNSGDMQWAFSHIDQEEDETYTDIGGATHATGGSGCTTIYYVSPEDSNRILYLDPWLMNDESHEVGTPYHARFKVESLSVSASTLFIVNKYGDMFTRTFDYDNSGADQVFFDYSWYGNTQTLIGNAIKLPTSPWKQQPKIPGEITNRITVENTGAGNENRLLKVEGKKDGKTGYWKKMVDDTTWTFVETGLPLEGELLKNSSKDTSMKDLAPETGIDYTGTFGALKNVTMTVKDFAYNDNNQYVYLTVGNVTVPATLYMEAGNLGTMFTQTLLPKKEGLTEELRRYTAALVISDEVYEELEKTVAGQTFLNVVMLGENLRALSVQANEDYLLISNNQKILPGANLTSFYLYRT